MDNNERFSVTTPDRTELANGWGGGWGQTGDPTAARRAKGSWGRAFGAFVLAAPIGLAADATLWLLLPIVHIDFLLIPAAAMLAALVLVVRRMPGKVAAGTVLGFLLGVLSPAIWFIYMLATTPWGL